MKKLTLGLAVLLAGFTANSLAYLPTGTNTSRCAVTVPSYCGGFTFGLTGLYWRATSPQQDFATTFDSFTFTDGDFIGTGDATTHNHRYKYDWGFQANVGYIFPCSGNDVNLTYTHWDRTHNAGTNAFVGPSDLGLFAIDAFGPTVAFTQIGGGSTATATLPISVIIDDPGFTFTSFNNAVSARTEFENHTWDLDFGQAINVGCNFRLRWFGGLRYTQLENKRNLTIATNFSGVDDSLTFDSTVLTNVVGGTLGALEGTDGTTTIDDVALSLSVVDFTREHSKFNGIGPRFGFDIAYNVACGFGVVGSLSTSLLVGEVRNSFSEEFSGLVSLTGDPGPNFISVDGVESDLSLPAEPFPFDTGLVTFNQPNETRVVPNIDAKLGLDYTYQFCNCSRTKLTVEAGYLVSHYFNSIDRLATSDLSGNDFDGARRTIDTSFDGPYVSVQVAL